MGKAWLLRGHGGGQGWEGEAVMQDSRRARPSTVEQWTGGLSHVRVGERQQLPWAALGERQQPWGQAVSPSWAPVG